MELIGIIDENILAGEKKIFGHPVYSLKDARNLNLDAILITSVNDREKKIKKVQETKGLGGIRVEFL